MAIVSSTSINFGASPRGFVVLEGVNGAGKSSLLARLKEYLVGKGVAHRPTFEPGDTEPGAPLRRILLESWDSSLHPVSELFLFCADRREHVERVIKPSMAANTLVLSDRYYYSTVAFQCYGRGLDRAFVNAANQWATDGVIPDVVLLLDLDEAEGLRRTRQRASGVDSFETQEIDFHKRLRHGFLRIAEELPEPFIVLDAALSPESIFQEAKEVLDRLLLAWRKDRA